MKRFKTTLSPFWQSHLSAWRSSGKSQGGYCRENGLKISTFNAHKTKQFGLDAKLTEKGSLELVAVPAFTNPFPAIIGNVNTCSGLSILLGKSATIKIAAAYDSKCLNEVLRLVAAL